MQVFDENISAGYTAAEFHPDGLILGTGTADSSVVIWEARQSKVCPLCGHCCHSPVVSQSTMPSFW